MDVLTEFLQSAREPSAFLVLFALLFVLGKFLNDLISSYEIDRELTKADNPALAISTGGYYLGLIIVFIGAVIGPSTELLWDLLIVGGILWAALCCCCFHG